MKGWGEKDFWAVADLEFREISDWYAPLFEILDLALHIAEQEEADL